jgi:DNA-directed RNA polymerase specialized sigma24 family protein
MPGHQQLTTTYSIRRTDKEVQKNLDPKYQPLYSAIRAAFTPNDKDSRSLWMSVQAELNRYGLGQSDTASAVLHAALLRGKQTIDKGKTIPNPSAWLRLTCRYIIKEKQRGSQRETQLESSDSIASQLPEDTLEDPNNDKHAALKKELQLLSNIDQEILMLKVVHELNWEEVQTRLVDMGYQQYSLPALRQRKSRVVLQLRQNLSRVYYSTRKEVS